jgi:hypothetical protein
VFLQEFGEHANIIKLLNVIKADNDKDIYLVFEYMGNCSRPYRKVTYKVLQLFLFVQKPTCIM